MSQWIPTHVQFTVLRARNLVAKGKGGNNDVFVTIQLGKEKYQTSTIKNALNPEWFEECYLPIPHMGMEVKVCLYHRALLTDHFLGYVAVPLWEYKVNESSKNSWLTLRNKPSKGGSDKYRGELEVKVAFHCLAPSDLLPQGLRKRSNSIRSLTSSFGEKFKLNRTRSFRESRGESLAGNMDKCRTLGNVSTDNRQPEEGLVRSYSLSATQIKTMSLDRGRMASTSVITSWSPVEGSSKMDPVVTHKSVQPGPQLSALGLAIPETPLDHPIYSLPVARRSSEVTLNKISPQSVDPKFSSKDDSVVMSSKSQPALPDPPPTSPAWNSGSSHFESTRLSGIYEIIKEKTEPENSTSTSDPESVPMPKPRVKKFSTNNTDTLRSKSQDYTKDFGSLPLSGRRTNSTDQQAFNTRDSGILDDRSSSLGNSQEGSLAVPEGTNSGSKPRNLLPLADYATIDPCKRTAPKVSSGSGRKLLSYEQEMVICGTSQNIKKIVPASQPYSQENMTGELVVRKKSRGQRNRNRVKQTRQQGAYDESSSEPSESIKSRVPDDMMTVFKNMSKEELLRVVITSKAQMIRKDQYIKDLENHIDSLLVRVMETTPRLLTLQPFQRL